MYLIIGLGNPGKEHENTPHNAGFMVVDELARIHGFSPFTLSKKHSSLISEGVLSQVKVVLAKPQTFMNNSGKAVQSLLSKTKSDLVVIHDDIDILLGKIKVSKSSGSAGHKGVDSIIQSLGTKDFTRIRIGIQPAKGKPEDVENFVLKSFRGEKLELFNTVIEESRTTIENLLAP